MVQQPRIWQQQEATNMPGAGKDRGRRWGYKSPKLLSCSYWVGDGIQEKLPSRSQNHRGRVCLTKGGATEETQLLSKVLPEAEKEK